MQLPKAKKFATHAAMWLEGDKLVTDCIFFTDEATFHLLSNVTDIT
jgi:hypothetical protein